MKGKRGCAIKLAFLLHVLGFLVLLAGCVTPYWSTIKDTTTAGEVKFHHQGLLVYFPDDDWKFLDFNELKNADSSDTVLYQTLAVGFALLTVFLELFLVQALAFAIYNRSCGEKYSPDCLMFFSFLSGLSGITTLALYQQFLGRSIGSVHEFTMNYSRGFIILFISATFLACFLLTCDRKPEEKSWSPVKSLKPTRKSKA